MCLWQTPRRKGTGRKGTGRKGTGRKGTGRKRTGTPPQLETIFITCSCSRNTPLMQDATITHMRDDLMMKMWTTTQTMTRAHTIRHTQVITMTAIKRKTNCKRTQT